MMDRLVSLSVGTVGSDDYFQTFQNLSELASNLGENHEYVTVSASGIDVDNTEEVEPELFYRDENTLHKVRKAILDIGYSSHSVEDIITHVQSNGVVFCERVIG
jgi:hypothetical protein